MYDFHMGSDDGHVEEALIRWIADGLKKRGKTQQGLATALGISQPRISEMLRGDRSIKAAEVPTIAEYLGEAPPPLTPLQWHVTAIKIAGRVQAGHWADPGEEEDAPPQYVHVPLSRSLQAVRPFALRVVGPSMNRLYPEGTILVCALLYDLHEDDGIPGKRYIVRQTGVDGRIETTVKEFVVDSEGRRWLWPRSDHPAHQQPLEWNESTAKRVELHARVIGQFSLD